MSHTGSAKDTGDLDELYGGLSGIHVERFWFSRCLSRSVYGGRRRDVDVAVVGFSRVCGRRTFG